MGQQDIKRKVRTTAEVLLKEKGYISPVDLLITMERLSKESYEDWRFGKIPYLEKACIGNLSKLSLIMRELKKYSVEKKLRPSWTAYKKWGKGTKYTLRFSKSGDTKIEKAYSTHYLISKTKDELKL